MSEIDIKSNVDNEFLELMISYGKLKSILEIFVDAVDYDTKLDNKYNDMIKVIEELVLDLEPNIANLSEQLKKLSESK